MLRTTLLKRKMWVILLKHRKLFLLLKKKKTTSKCVLLVLLAAINKVFLFSYKPFLDSPFVLTVWGFLHIQVYVLYCLYEPQVHVDNFFSTKAKNFPWNTGWDFYVFSWYQNKTRTLGSGPGCNLIFSWKVEKYFIWGWTAYKYQKSLVHFPSKLCISSLKLNPIFFMFIIQIIWIVNSYLIILFCCTKRL